jgi:hypothetical protein
MMISNQDPAECFAVPSGSLLASRRGYYCATSNLNRAHCKCDKWCRYDEVRRCGKFIHGDKVQVNKYLNDKFMGSPLYALCLGFHPEGKEPDGQRPVGWGAIAVKIHKESEPKHYWFKISHKGFFCAFRKDTKKDAQPGKQSNSKLVCFFSQGELVLAALVCAISSSWCVVGVFRCRLDTDLMTCIRCELRNQLICSDLL